MEAFFSLPHGGAEIGGILFGTRSGGGVRILAFRPFPCEHAFGPSFTLSENDEANLLKLLDSGCADLRKQGLEPVGWFHTHTRSEIFLSDQDVEVYNRYFPDAMQVALVVRPHIMKPTRAGFFFREADGSIHGESSYREFQLEPAAASAPGDGTAPTAAPVPEPAPAPAPAAAPGERRQEAAPAPERSLPEPPIPAFLTAAAPERSWQWLWWVSLIVALGAAAFAFRYAWMPVLTHEPVLSASLMAFDLDGQLQIHWDRATEPVRSATAGILEITDGVNKTVVALDPRRLQGGTFSYARRTGRVDVRLALDREDGKKFEEFTSFLGQAPGPAHSSAPPAPDASTRLRKELRDQAERTRQLEQAIRDMQSQIQKEQENQKK